MSSDRFCRMCTMKVKNIVKTVFSPDIFKALVYLVSLLGVCPLLGASVDPVLKLFHVYALLVVVFDLLGEKRILRNKGRVFLVIFGLCYAVTIINNSSLQNFSDLSNFCYLLAELGLIFSYGKNSRRIDRITGSALVTLISMANLVGIWMFFAKTHINIPDRGYIGIFVFENRLAGLFGNPNVLGMICMGAICLSAILLAASHHRWQRIYFGALCGVNILTLLLSNSRTQLYSVIFMCVVLVFMQILRSGISAKRMLLGCGAAVLTVAVVYFGTVAVQYGISKQDKNYDYYLRYISEDNLQLPEEVEFDFEGLVMEDGVNYYYEGGEKVYAGLIQINEDYYYINSSCQAVTGEYWISKTNGLMPEGTYEFDEDGKMILPDPEEEERKKGKIVIENGQMYYYENEEKTYAGLVKIEEDYYYVNGACRVVTGEYQVTKTNGLLPAGTYEFDQDGKMIRTNLGTEVTSTGEIIAEDGVLYYWEGGEKVYAGLIWIDGDYYYVNSACRVVTGEYQVTKTNGLLPTGTYEFGEDGKMVQTKNGFITEDGVMYYYENGQKTYAGLIKIGEDYYYINSGGQVVTGSYQITKTNDLLPVATYTFDETGKMIKAKNGFVTENGAIYYYVDGEKYYAGLMMIDEDYYYVNSSGRVVTGTYQITKTNGLMPVDSYEFDEDGKMIQKIADKDKHGIVAEEDGLYYYENGEKVYVGLIQIDQYYYYVNSQCQVVTGTYKITKTNGLLPENTYEFGEDGKLIRVHTDQETEARPVGDTSINREESEGFNGRVELWMTGLELFKAKPVFGVGLDNHDEILAELGLPALPVRGNLHNAYIDLLVCCGLAGFACMLAFLLTMLADVIKFFRFNDGKTWTLGTVMLASMAAFLLDGMADSTLISSFYPTAVSFWYIASQFANLLEEEEKRTGRYRQSTLCRLTDRFFDRKNSR